MEYIEANPVKAGFFDETDVFVILAGVLARGS